MEDFGIKVAKVNKDARSKDRKDLHFTSAAATYMSVRKIPVKTNTGFNPYVVIHNLGYIPKVFVFHVLSGHNRKLPYNDSSNNWYDFSVTKNEVKIREPNNESFIIYIFAQSIL